MIVDLQVSLPADFVVWAASPAAAFLKGKLVWSNWDVEELMARAEEIEAGNTLTLGLNGWPYLDFTSKSSDTVEKSGQSDKSGQ